MKKIILLFILGLLLAGCSGQKEILYPDDVKPDEVDIVGFNIFEHINDKTEIDVPPSNYFYGQLIVDTKLTKNAFSGKESEELLDYIVKIFGKEHKQFAIAITPTLNTTKLPKKVLFYYSYDSSKNKWKSDYVQRYVSPRVLLKANSQIEYKFEIISTKNTNVNIIKHVTDIVSEVVSLSSGSWVISELSKKTLSKSIASADKLISNSLTVDENSSFKGLFEPVTTKTVKKTYTLKGFKNKKLGNVSTSIRFIPSLVSGGSFSYDNIPSNFDEAIPKNVSIVNPLNSIDVNSKDNTSLYEHLTSELLYSNIISENNHVQFKNKCHSIINLLTSKYGLNIFDNLNAFSHLLRDTSFYTNKELYYSGCLTSSQIDLMKNMGIDMDFIYKDIGNKKIKISDEKLNKLAGFFKSPIANKGHKNKILDIFSDSIYINNFAGIDIFNNINNPNISKELLFEKFKTLSAARVCCWNGNVENKEGEPIELSKPIYIRRIGSPNILVIELFQNKTNSLISSVNIRLVDDFNITPRDKKKLIKKAEADVEGYLNDI